MPINIFISYSHKDREYVEKIETALFMLIKYKKIIFELAAQPTILLFFCV